MSDDQDGPLAWGSKADEPNTHFDYVRFSPHSPAGNRQDDHHIGGPLTDDTGSHTTDGAWVHPADQEASPGTIIYGTGPGTGPSSVDGAAAYVTRPSGWRDRLLASTVGTSTPGMLVSLPGHRESLLGDEVLRDESNAQLYCRVLAPTMHTGPSGLPGVDESYWVYPIVTHSSLPSWPATQTKVVRRFKDVVALADVLERALPGYILPARPRRNAVAARRASPAFLQERRAALERYLNRLAAHPAAAAHEALQLFLTSLEADLRGSSAWMRVIPPPPTTARSLRKLFQQMMGKESATPSAADVTRSASQTGDVLRLVREGMADLSGIAKALPVTPLERELREEAARIEEVKRLLGVVAVKADAWVESGQAAAGAAANLSKALHALAAYHEAFGETREAAVESAAAEGVASAATLMALAVDQSASHLASIHDHLVGTPAALHALAQRERALLTAATLEHDLAKARGALDGAQASGVSGGSKVQGLSASVAQLEEAVAAARGEYSRLGSRNAEEVAAWRARMSAELVATAKEVAIAQVVGAEKEQQVWEDTARKLGTLA